MRPRWSSLLLVLLVTTVPPVGLRAAPYAIDNRSLADEVTTAGAVTPRELDRRLSSSASTALLLVLLLTTAPPLGVTAAAYSVENRSDTNQVRAAAGVAPLAFDQRLLDIARGWTDAMRRGRFLAHNRNAPAVIAAVSGGWRVWGENVGYGPSIEWIHERWVTSPSHYINLIDPMFTHSALSLVYTDDGSVFAVQLFAG
ncbi:MAG: CAP domain-containing protein [Actinomycetota bacterium]|nr:CAP domain-containing protein [Actinomycetota bacterium]